ncbi:MAG: trehalose-phosphatase [Roseofilum sp. SID2]|uniref:trehalose-phosphatase n=1 Tax=unclassified Roseofilum TaxID=2620099 RepID=UPI001AFD4FE6|nr:MULTISPECIES: trehalose-phosphatase [unclassified Roseofilum]MBP0015919.1 trehalose-phosphatase [Roseofilum sp. SID3]MBP0023790.1 trehalose-phosphatase [Roseofilum sp. SID2]MBP0038933.1 trehalose-phosphatase [Roseofilum sp. SID1]
MEILSTRIDIELFFRQIATAKDRLLLLDYDGTLAPFCVDRDRAFPYPGVIEILSDMHQKKLSRIVIITGRAVKDLTPLLDIEPLPEIWGSHGWEYLSSNGEYVITSPDPATQQRLSQVKAHLSSLSLMPYCEQKPVNLALHWRGLSSDIATSIKSQVIGYWEEIEKVSNLRIHYFDGGMEMRIEGKDKGTAVQSIIYNVEPNTPIAYLGDDITDEDAFQVLSERALNVLVRKELRSTYADIWIKPPEELTEFLYRWKSSCLEGS